MFLECLPLDALPYNVSKNIEAITHDLCTQHFVDVPNISIVPNWRYFADLLVSSDGPSLVLGYPAVYLPYPLLKALLAHELSHLFLGHLEVEKQENSNHYLELEADRSAARILGGPQLLDKLFSHLEVVFPGCRDSSSTHPSMETRRNALGLQLSAV